jgi:hypothetical protein
VCRADKPRDLASSSPRERIFNRKLSARSRPVPGSISGSTAPTSYQLAMVKPPISQNTTVSYGDAVPGAAIAVHTFGDFQQFHPHLHLIATDGCFAGSGTITKTHEPEPKDLIELFRYEVLKMLKAEGKISDTVIENMLSWRHSGLNVYCGPTIWPNNDQGLEDPARYIIRACFSQQRMTHIAAADTLDGQAKVIYRSKDGRTSKTFEALDWLAQLVTHIPDKGERMVRYYVPSAWGYEGDFLY